MGDTTTHGVVIVMGVPTVMFGLPGQDAALAGAAGTGAPFVWRSARPDMNLELVIVDGPEAGRHLPVNGTPTVFGRATTAALSFPQDGYMSGNHLMVQAAPQGVLLTDLHSTNGTFLNGQRITQAVAAVGDTVRLGNLTLRIQPAQEAGHPASTAFIAPSTSLPAPGMVPAPAPSRQDPPTLAPQPQTIPSLPIPPRRDSGTTVLPQLGRELFSPPPLQSQPAPPAPGLPPVPAPSAFQYLSNDPVHERLLQALTTADKPLYCLLDAASDPNIEREFMKLQIDPLPCSLHSGESAAIPARWALYLFPLPPASPLLSLLVERGWNKAWASYFTSDAPFEDLRKHFRRFLMVQVEGKGEVYFRFYDPRVLREFLPAASLQELAMFFGPVQEWYLESGNPEVLLRLGNSPQGLVSQTIKLA